MRRPRGPLVLALVPVLAMGFVLYEAGSEDKYVDDGRSYWETHPSGQGAVIVAALVSVGALVTLFIVRGGGRLEWAVAAVATFISAFAAAFALVALTAN